MTPPTPSPVRALADTLVTRLLDADPFHGSSLGLREYDALVPDASAAAQAALDVDLADLADRAATLAAQGAARTPADRVTLAAITASCRRNRLDIAAAGAEYLVTPMPIGGPPELLAQAARTALVDARAAEDHLTRLHGSATWLDAGTQRLREGAARGRLPVASLVARTVAWADGAVDGGALAAFTAPAPPPGWDGADAWRHDVERVVVDEIVPAVGRWRDLLVELQPQSRSDDRPGLVSLPGGAAEYERAIEIHTTLDLTADELHRIGLAEVARLEARAVELGATIGLADLAAVVTAVRAASAELEPSAALAAAQAAVVRAESRAAEIMPPPLPAPCAVQAMPPTVAQSGIAPHYTRPKQDGSRPGTFWFNTVRATAGTGWDLEAVAFHEAVPGHHSQLARAAVLPDLPMLQQLSVTAHSEGWGLYAERLAGEFGLYSDTRAELGAVYIEMHRAARLVVDTGLHAQGWSRSRARDYLVEHVALPEAMLADETDRYIAWPGQALAYLVGQREILRLRADAQERLGARFDLVGFNGAVLDSGSVPLPVLGTVVDQWVERCGGQLSQ